MSDGVPTWLKALLASEFLVALLFFFFGYSQTKGNALGRSPSMTDVVALAVPLLLVLLCGAVAVALARKGKILPAILLGSAPLPIAMVLAVLSGAIV